MKTKFIVALLASGVAFASTAQATAINLSATDTTKSSFTETFGPGSYIVSLVKDTYSAWAPATPSLGNWTDYYKYTIDGTDAYFNPLNSVRFASADAAFAAYSSAPQLQLTFAKTTDVTFSIADAPSSFWDNSGGVSLSTAAVPEAATWAMMVLGFGVIGYGMRNRKVGATTLA